MAFLVIVVDSTPHSIAQLNAKLVSKPVTSCADYLMGILAGAYPANVQVTTRDTDPSVATSGSGSAQNSYTHK